VLLEHGICVGEVLGNRYSSVGFQLEEHELEASSLEIGWPRVGEVLGPRWSVANPQYLC